MVKKNRDQLTFQVISMNYYFIWNKKDKKKKKKGQPLEAKNAKPAQSVAEAASQLFTNKVCSFYMDMCEGNFGNINI